MKYLVIGVLAFSVIAGFLFWKFGRPIKAFIEKYLALLSGLFLVLIVGGFIADRLLGRTRTIIVGALLMSAGHFLMAFEPAFYPALACIALGNGFFLPSLPICSASLVM